MIINKKIFLIFCTLFLINLTNSQNKKTKESLLLIIKSIEKQHKVVFNFKDEDVASIVIEEPQKKITLDKKLKYLKAKTNLTFEKIFNNYISITKQSNLNETFTCGYIKDIETNLPIENVIIYNFDLTKSTQTDNNGYFELKIKTNTNLNFKHFSYESKIISPSLNSKNTCYDFFLAKKIIEIEPIITTTYLTKGITKSTNGTILIKPKKLGLLPGLTEPDVLQTIQQIPGIISTNESISDINVRGGTNDQNLISWNGIRLFQTGHFFGLISAINPNLSNKISISKNGNSAFLGESVSSNIDISTHENLIDNNKASIGLNMLSIDFYTKLKTSKKSNLEISGRRSYTDFYKSPTYKSYFNKIFQNTIIKDLVNNQNLNYKAEENFSFYDSSLQYHQQIGEKTNLYFDALTISNNLDFNEVLFENNTILTKKSFLNQVTYGGNFSINTKWNGKFSTDLILYGSNYNIVSNNSATSNNQILDQTNNVFDTGTKLKVSYLLSDSFHFFGGYQYNEIGIRSKDKINNPFFSRNIKEVLRSHISIVEMNYFSKNEKLISRIGIRNNYIEELKTFLLEPRLHLNYKLNTNFSIELQAEQKHQTTSQIIDLQQDFLGIEKKRWALSNNFDLPIIKSKQISLGFSFDKKRWLITLDNFYKKTTGITSMSQGFQNQLEFSRIKGNFSIFGTEFLIQKEFKGFTTWLNYTFTKNDYSFSTYNPSEFSNNYEITNAIISAIIYDYKKIKIALGGKYFSGKPNTLPKSYLPQYLIPTVPSISFENPNSSNIENYFQLNFSISYFIAFKNKSKIFIGFSVQNLLNEKVTSNQFFRLNNGVTAVEEVDSFALTRTPNVFIRFVF